MRDIIWTIIVIWLIYRLVDVFKVVSEKRSFTDKHNENYDQQTSHYKTASHTKEDIKSAVKKHVNNEGEYVDFEELK